MRFSVEMQLSEISALLSRMIAITGAAIWTQREKDFSRQIAQNPLIGGYLDIQFALERGDDPRAATPRNDGTVTVNVGPVGTSSRRPVQLFGNDRACFQPSSSRSAGLAPAQAHRRPKG
jgi:hypothetical protein